MTLGGDGPAGAGGTATRSGEAARQRYGVTQKA